MDSQSLKALDERYLASVLKIRFFPMTIASASGNRIVDVDGRPYLDFTAGWAVANTGYNDARIRQAVFEQFTATSFASLTTTMNEPSVRLAARLVDLTPGVFDKKVWYGLHGSDANDTLAKLVPLATGRQRIISFIGGYHGQTAGSAALSGHTAQARFASGASVVKVPYPNPYRPLFGEHDPGQAVLDYLENYVLRTICPPDDTAAVIVEAMQSDGGDIVPPDGFLPGLESLCRRHGILLLVDEVKTGVGRTGRMFAFEHFDLTPDVISLGKSLGGGMPISAVIGRREILDVGTAINLYTMAGSPTACAAALANLEVIEKEKLVDRAARTGTLLLNRLRDLKDAHPLLGDVRGLGLMLGVEAVRDRRSKQPAARETAKIVYRAHERGLLVFYGGIYSNVLEITPPLTLSAEEVEEGVAILDEVIGEVEAGQVPDALLGEYAGW